MKYDKWRREEEKEKNNKGKEKGMKGKAKEERMCSVARSCQIAYN